MYSRKLRAVKLSLQVVANVARPLVCWSLQSIPHGQRQGFLQVVQVLRHNSGITAACSLVAERRGASEEAASCCCCCCCCWLLNRAARGIKSVAVDNRDES